MKEKIQANFWSIEKVRKISVKDRKTKYRWRTSLAEDVIIQGINL